MLADATKVHTPHPETDPPYLYITMHEKEVLGLNEANGVQALGTPDGMLINLYLGPNGTPVAVIQPQQQAGVLRRESVIFPVI